MKRKARFFASPFAALATAATAATAAAVVSACGAPPDASTSTPEATGTTEGALNPTQVLAATSYRIQIDGLENVYENDNKYGGGFVDWAELGVRVNEDDPSLLGCTLGRAQKGVTLSTCQDGVFSKGEPIWRVATVHAETDVVKIALVLDNVENSSASSAGSSAASSLATLGDTVAGAGAIAGIGSGPVGGVVALIGAGLSVAGDIFGASPHQEVSCAGGLVGLPNPVWAASVPFPLGSTSYVPNRPEDTMYLTFSAAQLEQMTADGPAQLTFNTSVVWPGPIFGEDPGTCNSAHAVHVSIARDWNTGLAPSPKSGDSGNARLTQELNWFQADTATSSLRRRYWNQNGWMSADVTAAKQFAVTSPFMPVASISRQTSNLDAFFADQNGRLVWTNWTDGKGWSATPVVSGLPANAHLSVAARHPDMFDLFVVGTSGALETSHWPMSFFGATYLSNPAPISGAGIAPAGAGIAAVARTANNLDVFFVGNNGALYSSYWYDGATSWTTFQVSQAGIAPPGARVTAAARTTDNLDVFFVGNNGAVYSSYWYVGAPSWATFQLTAGNQAVAGGAISVVSRQSTNLDVAYVGAGYKVYVSEWSWPTWQPPVQVSTSPGQLAYAGGDSSIVARSAWNLDVFYRDVFGQSFASTWQYASSSWSSRAIP